MAKFDKGQVVWYTITDFESVQVKSGTVVGIHGGSSGAYFYELDNGCAYIEERFYDTKEAAIRDATVWCAARIKKLTDSLLELYRS